MPDVCELRPDWKTARFIYRTCGLAAARKWMSLPLLDISTAEDGYMKKCRELRDGPRESTAGCYDHMPFENFLIYAPAAVFRVTRDLNPLPGLPVRENDAALSYMAAAAEYLRKRSGRDDIDPVYLAMLSLDREGEPTDPQLFPYGMLVDNGSGDCLFLGSTEAIRSLNAEKAGALNWLAAAALLVIDEAEEHLVEVTPSPSRSVRKVAHTAEHKPWLRTDARRVILMNLSEARRYGHSVDRGGTHASPHPHQRRGHFASLRHERYRQKRGQRVWVRPAWVGDTEWDFEGQHYKVLIQTR